MGELRGLIYLIDDEASVVKSLSRLLRTYDFDVHGFHAADSFLAAYQPLAHRCIILLPNMDGFALGDLRPDARSSVGSSFFPDVPMCREALRP
jgi:two-component system, LuxR family, response regulator TtrR